MPHSGMFEKVKRNFRPEHKNLKGKTGSMFKKNKKTDGEQIQDAAVSAVTKKDKKKSKKIKKRIIIGVIAAVILALMTIPKIFAPEVLPMVTTETAFIGNVEQILDTSGEVNSELTKTYFSAVQAKVAECSVEAGNTVAVGETLLTYDTQDAELATKEADLTNRASQSGYQNSLTKNAENEAELADSAVQEQGYEYLVYKKKEEIRYINDQISNTQLNITIMNRDPDTSKSEEELTEEYLGYEKDIKNYQTRLAVVQDELAELQSRHSEYESKKNTAESSLLTANEKAQIAAQKELAALEKTKAQNALEKAKAGVISEFNGIVTEVQAVKGAMVAEGTSLFTIASSDDVNVKILLSKYDLEKVKPGQKADIKLAGFTYTGSVSKIDKIAQKNQSGNTVIAAEIHIDNPDENLYLGVEAKVSVHIAESKNTVLVPVQAINTGKEGDFCYTVENGIVMRKLVTTGVSSDEYIEIKEGIKEGEQIISMITEGIVEGAKVNVMPSMQTGQTGNAAEAQDSESTEETPQADNAE